MVNLLRVDKFDFFHDLYTGVLVCIFSLYKPDCTVRSCIDEKLP